MGGILLLCTGMAGYQLGVDSFSHEHPSGSFCPFFHCLAVSDTYSFSILAADVASAAASAPVRNVTYRIAGTKVCDHILQYRCPWISTPPHSCFVPTHSLLGRKNSVFWMPPAAGVGSKRKRSILDSLASFHLRDLKFFVLTFKHLISSFIVDIHSFLSVP